LEPIEARKQDHIRLSLTEDVQFERLPTGFDSLRFEHLALPELDFAEIDPSVTFLGKRLAAPLIISSMTGGPAMGGTINRNLAEAAQRAQIAMGLGSQRITLEKPESTTSFQVRDVAPDVLLIGNIGAVQLNYGVGLEECRRLVESVGADALYLHLNPLQEVIQPEGDQNFKGLLAKIRLIASELGVPVLAKEVGSGISGPLAKQLAEAGIAAIDVSGAGGTSWALIEAKRAPHPLQQSLGERFRDWGIPTTRALVQCRDMLPEMPLVASGGIRTGIDVAKAIALGADAAAMAHPFLEAATRSSDAVAEVIDRLVQELKIAMFLVGARTIADLKGRRDLLAEER
jgi:isopentenyl-diphosphate delta-isomerase